jgi:DNA-binding response OmpR family regulator
MNVCPNCGFRHGEHGFGEGLSCLALPRYERIVLTRLIAARGGWVSNAQLVDAIYGDHPDGGPETAPRMVWCHTSKLNKKVKRIGWRIDTARFIGYRLERQP